MRTITIFIGVFLFILFVATCNRSCFANEESLYFNSKTFDGIEWGTDIRKLSSLECKFQFMGEFYQCFFKEKDNVFLGINLRERYYIVNNRNQLDCIFMLLNNRQDWEKLKDRLVEELGDQYIGDLAGDKTIYTWQKDDLEIKLTDSNQKSYPAVSFFLEIIDKKFYITRSEQVSVNRCINHSCNVNLDNTCDAKDLELVDKAIGQCNKPGNYFYNSDADIDHDNCITKKDRAIVERNLGSKGYDCNKM